MSISFLITGATGKQGRSTIQALLAHKSFSPSTHSILAVTRDPASTGAQNLLKLSPAIKLVRGDFETAPEVVRSLPTPPTGVFAVGMPGKNEVAQGVSLIDAAARAGVRRFVATTVERGGEGPTEVPHFATKYEIEQHLTKVAAEKGFDYTILRPVFFLDNAEWGFIGEIMMTAWRDHLKEGQKLQVIDTKDIGLWAADALMGQDPELRNAKISLAGDDLSFNEANRIFKEETGNEIPTTFGFLASILLFMVGDVGKMFKFFREQGFKGDVQALKASGRQVTDFRAWVKKSSFGKKDQ